MARAEKKPVEDYQVVLTLTREEAETLRQVVRRIGGSASASPRVHTDAIGSALYHADIDIATHEIDADARAIYFK